MQNLYVSYEFESDALCDQCSIVAKSSTGNYGYKWVIKLRICDFYFSY
jgi:hypothetical protein